MLKGGQGFWRMRLAYALILLVNQQGGGTRVALYFSPYANWINTGATNAVLKDRILPGRPQGIFHVPTT